MAGKFELKTIANGKFMFNLKAGNGEIILSSQQYKSRRNALKGIESVRKNAQFEIKTAANGEVFFVLKAKNSQVIGKSETYPTEAVLKKGVASVKNNAPEAKLVELEADK